MLLVPTRLKESPIHGIGVHAAAPIKAGTRIWELREGFDVIIDEGRLKSYPEHVQQFIDIYTYPHPTKKNCVILEADNGRFMNHSDKPNTDFSTVDKGIALVDIAEGEEITCNYHEFCYDGFTLV